MRLAEKIFVQTVLDEYVPWSCKVVSHFKIKVPKGARRVRRLRPESPMRGKRYFGQTPKESRLLSIALLVGGVVLAVGTPILVYLRGGFWWSP